MFAKLNEPSESHGSSDRVTSEQVSSEDDVITVSDHDDDEATPATIVAEEHDLHFV